MRLFNIPGKFPILLWHFWILKFLSKATVYAPVYTTNPQIPIVICCIHLHIHHMSRILFLILSFLDFVAFVVKTLISP